jgi:hypothetical protein
MIALCVQPAKQWNSTACRPGVTDKDAGAHGQDSGPSRACDARCPSDHGQSGARLFPAYGS